MKKTINLIAVGVFTLLSQSNFSTAAESPFLCSLMVLGIQNTYLDDTELNRSAVTVLQSHSIDNIAQVAALEPQRLSEILSQLDEVTARESFASLMKIVRMAVTAHLDESENQFYSSLSVNKEVKPVRTPLSKIKMSTSSHNFMKTKGYFYLEDIAVLPSNEFLEIAGLRRMFIIEEALFEHGLHFADREIAAIPEITNKSEISALPLPLKLVRTLESVGFKQIYQLQGFYIEDALKGNLHYPGIGRLALTTIQKALVETGFPPLKLKGPTVQYYM